MRRESNRVERQAAMIVLGNGLSMYRVSGRHPYVALFNWVLRRGGEKRLTAKTPVEHQNGQNGGAGGRTGNWERGTALPNRVIGKNPMKEKRGRNVAQSR